MTMVLTNLMDKSTLKCVDCIYISLLPASKLWVTHIYRCAFPDVPFIAALFEIRLLHASSTTRGKVG